MESQIKSSFIPQDVGKQSRPTRVKTGSGSDLLMLGAIILLIASLTLAGGVFLYSKYLNNSISVKQGSIDRARAAIDPGLIEELSRLDNRMDASGALLAQHLSLSAVFALLEQITLESVQLNELSITTDGNNTIALQLDGEAESVNSIALQSDLYGKSGIITSPIFSDITRKTNGLTSFHIDALLNPDAIRYRNLYSTQQQRQTETTEQPQQTTESPSATTTPSSESSEPIE